MKKEKVVLKKWVEVVVIIIAVLGFCLMAGDDINNEMSILSFFFWKLAGVVMFFFSVAILDVYGRQHLKK